MTTPIIACFMEAVFCTDGIYRAENRPLFDGIPLLLSLRSAFKISVPPCSEYMCAERINTLSILRMLCLTSPKQWQAIKKLLVLPCHVALDDITDI